MTGPPAIVAPRISKIAAMTRACVMVMAPAPTAAPTLLATSLAPIFIGHVAGERHGGDDQGCARLVQHVNAGKDHGEAEEDQADTGSDQPFRDMIGRILDIGELVEILVQCAFLSVSPVGRACHSLNRNV